MELFVVTIGTLAPRKQVNMEYFNNFLESSTIHGLYYISTTKRFVRLFWILTVVTGFSVSCFLIHQSFESWADSPVKTTIETLPTSQIKFPNITVCPPKNTYTTLNYDLLLYENRTLNSDTRKELKRYVVELLLDSLYYKLMDDMSLLNDENRYYNWYNGFSRINVPFYRDNYKDNFLVNREDVHATSGSVNTRYFGDKFDIDKMEQHVYHAVKVHSSEGSNPNVTLHLVIENEPIEDLNDGYDSLELSINYRQTRVMKRKFYQKFSPPGWVRQVILIRKVADSEKRKLKLKQMPGFNLTWYHTSTSNHEMQSQAYYLDMAVENLLFVRNK